jgi:hypothetical protein
VEVNMTRGSGCGAAVLAVLLMGCGDSATGPEPGYALGPGSDVRSITVEQTVQGPELEVFTVTGRIEYAVQRRTELLRGAFNGEYDIDVVLSTDLEIRRVDCDDRCQRVCRCTTDRVAGVNETPVRLEKTYVFGPDGAPRFLRLAFQITPAGVALAGAQIS